MFFSLYASSTLEQINLVFKHLPVDITYVDENVEFLDGNATIKGDANYIIENGIKMYQELSKETKGFFDFMLENELMDLETKHNK